MSDPIQETVQLIAHCDSGCMEIYPPLAEIKDELYFQVRSFDRGGLVVDPETGRKRYQKGTGISVETRSLFVEQESGAIITHNNMYPRVAARLRELGIPFSYQKSGAWPVPTINPGVVKGLDEAQVTAVSSLLAAAQTGGGMVEACTGSGKTRVIAALIRAFKRHRIAVMTSSISVVRGLHQNLTELLEGEGIALGLCHGSHKDPKRITIVSTGTAEYIEPDEIDVLIVDEAHQVTGDKASSSVLLFNKALRFGLSGTISDRFDGKERLLESMFGPIAFTFTDQQAEESGRVCPLHAYFLSVPDGPDVEWLSIERRTKNGIWCNDIRNKLVKDAIDVAPADQQALIFVSTIEHLNELQKLMPEFEVCHGQLKKKEREEIEKRFVNGECLRLISTDCLSTGVDPRHLMIMIDASHVKGDAAMVQKRGRLRRHAPGKTHGVLINFMDEWSEKLGRKALKRVAEHKDRGDLTHVMARVEDIVFSQSELPEGVDETGQENLIS